MFYTLFNRLVKTSTIPDHFQQMCKVGLKGRLTSGPDNRGSTVLLLSSVLWSPLRFSLVTILFEDSTPFSLPWTSLNFLFKVGSLSLISEKQKQTNKNLWQIHLIFDFLHLPLWLWKSYWHHKIQNVPA